MDNNFKKGSTISNNNSKNKTFAANDNLSNSNVEKNIKENGTKTEKKDEPKPFENTKQKSDKGDKQTFAANDNLPNSNVEENIKENGTKTEKKDEPKPIEKTKPKSKEDNKQTFVANDNLSNSNVEENIKENDKPKTAIVKPKVKSNEIERAAIPKVIPIVMPKPKTKPIEVVPIIMPKPEKPKINLIQTKANSNRAILSVDFENDVPKVRKFNTKTPLNQITGTNAEKQLHKITTVLKEQNIKKINIKDFLATASSNGNKSYNMKIALARAIVVGEYAKSQGVEVVGLDSAKNTFNKIKYSTNEKNIKNELSKNENLKGVIGEDLAITNEKDASNSKCNSERTVMFEIPIENEKQNNLSKVNKNTYSLYQKPESNYTKSVSYVIFGATTPNVDNQTLNQVTTKAIDNNINSLKEPKLDNNLQDNNDDLNSAKSSLEFKVDLDSETFLSNNDIDKINTNDKDQTVPKGEPQL